MQGTQDNIVCGLAYIQEYSHLKGSKSANYTFKTPWISSKTGIAHLETVYTFLIIATKFTPT